MGLLPWEIQVAFRRESQLRKSHATQSTVHAGCFSVFIIHQTLTWIPPNSDVDHRIFNVCTDVNACARTEGVYGHRKRVCSESWLWEKYPLLHRGIRLASAMCQSKTLPTELHPHPIPSFWIGMEWKNRLTAYGAGGWKSRFESPVNMAMSYATLCLAVCLWCHAQSQLWQKCILCHEPTFFCCSLVKSEPPWLQLGEPKFKAVNKKYFCCTNP